MWDLAVMNSLLENSAWTGVHTHSTWSTEVHFALKGGRAHVSLIQQGLTLQQGIIELMSFINYLLGPMCQLNRDVIKPIIKCRFALTTAIVN